MWPITLNLDVTIGGDVKSVPKPKPAIEDQPAQKNSEVVRHPAPVEAKKKVAAPVVSETSSHPVAAKTTSAERRANRPGQDRGEAVPELRRHNRERR